MPHDRDTAYRLYSVDGESVQTLALRHWQNSTKTNPPKIRQKLLRPEAEKWRPRQNSLQPEAENCKFRQDWLGGMRGLGRACSLETSRSPFKML